MKFGSIISVLFACFIFCGCEDFLSEEDPSQVTNATFWKTKDDAEQGITAVYNGLKQNFLYGRQGIKSLNCRGDDIIARLQNAQIYSMDLFTNDASNTFARDLWKACYVIVFRANQVIESVPNIEMDNQRKNEIVLEAKFLRGFAYFMLAINFRQVPIVLEADSEDKYPAKASRESLWEQIYQDFTEAKGLPKSYTADKMGHATTYAAAAYLGKSYLYNQQYEKAIKEFEYIIKSNQFNLVADVNDNWNSTNENNEESIFELQYMYSPTSDQVNGRAEHFSPAGVGGYYVATPSDWIFKEFQKEKTVDGDFDPRMYGTFIWNYEGATIYQLPFLEFFADDPTYIAWKKFQLWDKSVEEASLWRSEINERIMRYGHVLLMYAEVLNEMGKTQEAIEQVNKIRLRAKLSPLENNIVQSDLREEIRHQRALEFCFEGERWYDIVRWGIGEKVFNENLDRSSYTSEKHDYFPIPQEELDANPNLTQNEGWN